MEGKRIVSLSRKLMGSRTRGVPALDGREGGPILGMSAKKRSVCTDKVVGLDDFCFVSAGKVLREERHYLLISKALLNNLLQNVGCVAYWLSHIQQKRALFYMLRDGLGTYKTTAPLYSAISKSKKCVENWK